MTPPSRRTVTLNRILRILQQDLGRIRNSRRSNEDGLPRLVFDARWYFRGPPSNRLVTLEVVKELRRYTSVYDISLLLNCSREERDRLRSTCGPMKLIRVPDLTMLGTSVLILPWVLIRIHADILIVQNFCVPFGARKRVVIIYDAIFLRNPKLFTWKERLYLSTIRPLSKRSDRIYTISETERLHLSRAGFGDEHKVRVFGLAPRSDVLNASPGKVFEARSAYALPKSYVLSLGRINVRKNIGPLLEACLLCPVITEDTPLVLAGPRSGAQDPLVDELLRTAGDRVRVLGYIPDDLVGGLLAGASALVSLSVEEGFGLPPLEAMAGGVPVLVGENKVAREVLQSAAYVVADVRNAQEVAAAIDRVMSDQALRERLVDSGRRTSAKHSWSQSVERLIVDLSTIDT